MPASFPSITGRSRDARFRRRCASWRWQSPRGDMWSGWERAAGAKCWLLEPLMSICPPLRRFKGNEVLPVYTNFLKALHCRGLAFRPKMRGPKKCVRFVRARARWWAERWRTFVCCSFFLGPSPAARHGAAAVQRQGLHSCGRRSHAAPCACQHNCQVKMFNERRLR